MYNPLIIVNSYFVLGPLLDLWRYDPISGNWSVLDANNSINRTAIYNSSMALPGGRSTYSVVFDKLRRRFILQGGRGFGSSTVEGIRKFHQKSRFLIHF